MRAPAIASRVVEISADHLHADGEARFGASDGWHRRGEAGDADETGPGDEIGVTAFLAVDRNLAIDEVGGLVVLDCRPGHHGAEQEVVVLVPLGPGAASGNATLLEQKPCPVASGQQIFQVRRRGTVRWRRGSWH